MTSEDEDGDWVEGATDSLSAIVGVRAELEPPVPAGLGSLTAPQRALADFLRLDADLLKVAAEGSPPLARMKGDPRRLASGIKDLPTSEKDELLHRVAEGHGVQVQTELLHRFGGVPGTSESSTRRSVADLLDAAAEARYES